MSNNGDKNTRFGVYQSMCCGAEIVIPVGTTFPDCPNHRKLTTTWRLVPEEKIRSRESNVAIPPIVTHIENRRLLDVSLGRIQLLKSEIDHLHECPMCQGVLNLFLNQPHSAGTNEKGKSEPAA